MLKMGGLPHRRDPEPPQIMVGIKAGGVIDDAMGKSPFHLEVL